MKCRHCDGTGIAHDKITLECVGCQKPVVIRYQDTKDLARQAVNVRCSVCSMPDPHA